MKNDINVWILSVDSNFAELIKKNLDERIYTVCLVNSLNSVSSLIDGKEPEIIIYDFPAFEEKNNCKALSRVCNMFDSTRMLLILEDEDQKLIYSVFCKGVYDYMLRGEDLLMIPNRIEIILKSLNPLQAVIENRIEQIKGHHSFSNPFNLSEREKEILNLLKNGMKKREIAARLSVSFHTIDSHIRHIYRKMGVQSRGEAVSKSINMIGSLL